MFLIENDVAGPARCRIPATFFIDRRVTINEWIVILTPGKVLHCRAWPFLRNPPANASIQADDMISRPLTDAETNELGEKPYVLRPISSKIPQAAALTIECDMDNSDINKIFMRNSINQLNGVPLKKECIVRLKIQSKEEMVKVVECDPDKLCMFGPQTRIKIKFSKEKQQYNSLMSDSLAMLSHQFKTLDIIDDGQEEEDEVEEDNGEEEISFDSVGAPPGLEKVFFSLVEMVEYPLFYSALLSKLNIGCPRGVLLYGVSGVGKSLLVSRLAEYCKVKLMTINGPDVYGSSLGESEERLRDKFNEAKGIAETSKSGCILFIDELDALTPHRGNAKQHESRVVAQLLTLMDGMNSVKSLPLVIIAATNRPNAIDPALRRPGRFEREVGVDIPSPEARSKILRYLTRKMTMSQDVDLDRIALSAIGYVGADLVNLCREMAMHSMSRNSTSFEITMQDIKAAMMKITPSLQRQTNTQSHESNPTKLSWDSIGGLDSIKLKLRQMVEWPLKHEAAFKRLGIDAPRGLLLFGPPGCSKTTLVKIIAATSGLTFLSLSGASVYSPYLGESERMIRETFVKARAAAPSVIFFDEIDSIIGKRSLDGGGGDSGGGTSVGERVLSTLLNEMDGVEMANGVLVVGATNRPDMIDAALMRPGRFDRILYVPPPDEASRIKILDIHSRKMPLADDFDLELLASDEYTKHFTGADLEGLCREAGMAAIRESRDTQRVNMRHFYEALSSITPTLSQESILHYEKFGRQFG